MNFVNKDTVRGVLFGAGLGLLGVTSYSWAETPATQLRPNTSVGSDSKAMLGATRLFRVENCEVWGFTWKDQARVVSVCPASTPVAEVKPVAPSTLPANKPTGTTVDVKPAVGTTASTSK